MSVLTFVYRFLVSNALTLLYCGLYSAILVVRYIVNLLKVPKANKLRLEPPAALSDPKYGVHKYIKANNIKLHYVESGDPSKPLMLFIHGFPEFWYSWRYQIVNFNKKYWCVAIDMRGYGDSERPEDVSSYHIDILLEDIRDLIRQLGRDKCIIVSHDWGGLITCRFRDCYPEIVLATILLGSSSREAWLNELWRDAEQMRKSWYIFFFRMPAIPEMFLEVGTFEKTMMVQGKQSISSEDIECYKYWFGKQCAFTPPINYYRANFVTTLPEKYKEDNVPLLVVHGANDRYLSRKLLDQMKKEYTHIETTVLEDCGHFLQQEEPDKVNKLIEVFLEKHHL